MTDNLLQIYSNHKGKVSDKWLLYLYVYDQLMQTSREKPINLLEIGVQNGGSLEIWAKYFANAKNIVGCDILSKCKKLKFADSRIKLVIGDVNNKAVLAKINQVCNRYDFIIDDGSHKSSDIIKTFFKLWPRLIDGGAYVIEDLHCSYWPKFSGGFLYRFSSISFIKCLIDIINHEYWGNELTRLDLLKEFSRKFSLDLREEDLTNIQSIKLLNSICIITKASNETNHLGKRIIAGKDFSIYSNIKDLKNSGTNSLINYLDEMKKNEGNIKIIESDNEALKHKNIMDKDELIAAVDNYKNKLSTIHPGEIWSFFKEIEFPYAIKNEDPFSEQYRSEVLQVYKDLTKSEYNTSNELTSNKQETNSFQRGFPWNSNDYNLIESHSTKHGSLFRLLAYFNYPWKEYHVLEFGPGWGLLTIPMLKAGMKVTVVDCDKGFLDRIHRESVAIEYGQLEIIHKDFCESFETISSTFDFFVFQSSFHHEINFIELLQKCVNKMHDEGAIIFLDEPILEDLVFPWGLRYDGESLWAITQNKWLELGFNKDFFISLLWEYNLFISSADTHGLGSPSNNYLARKSNVWRNFSEILLPKKNDMTFHQIDPSHLGRFTKKKSLLPGGLTNFFYKLRLINYRTLDMKVIFKSKLDCIELCFVPLQEEEVVIEVDKFGLTIISETFIPALEAESQDTRQLGIFVESISKIMS